MVTGLTSLTCAFAGDLFCKHMLLDLGRRCCLRMSCKTPEPTLPTTPLHSRTGVPAPAPNASSSYSFTPAKSLGGSITTFSAAKPRSNVKIFHKGIPGSSLKPIPSVLKTAGLHAPPHAMSIVLHGWCAVHAASMPCSFFAQSHADAAKSAGFDIHTCCARRHSAVNTAGSSHGNRCNTLHSNP